MAKVTGLSGNEIYCLALKNYAAGDLVVGNSVNSMGFLGSLGSGVKNLLGGEVSQVSEAIHAGRAAAFERLCAEAVHRGASGIAGVTGELRSFGDNTEFLFVGSCVQARSGAETGFFSSAGDAQELYCHMDAGYRPVQHVFGNIAYSTGLGRSLLGSLKTLARGEIQEFSDVFNLTRHSALNRAVAMAKQSRCNSVVGIRTIIENWAGTHEMLMSGTGAVNPILPDWTYEQPVTSDLTGSELWSLTSLGFAPVKLLMSTSIYSMGFVGGFMAALKSFVKGEINELTSLIHDAREIALDRISREADALQAEEVVGVKTYIADIGDGLVEFMAVGTAVRRHPDAVVATAMLPAQAIAADRDTWIDGSFGFSLDRDK